MCIRGERIFAIYIISRAKLIFIFNRSMSAPKWHCKYNYRRKFSDTVSASLRRDSVWVSLVLECKFQKVDSLLLPYGWVGIQNCFILTQPEKRKAKLFITILMMDEYVIHERATHTVWSLRFRLMTNCILRICLLSKLCYKSCRQTRRNFINLRSISN